MMANLFLPTAGRFPNPFSSTVTITYGVCANGVNDGATHSVTLSIKTGGGSTTRTGLSIGSDPGVYRVTWDGKNNDGDDVGSGTYYAWLVDALDSEQLNISIVKV